MSNVRRDSTPSSILDLDRMFFKTRLIYAPLISKSTRKREFILFHSTPVSHNSANILISLLSRGLSAYWDILKMDQDPQAKRPSRPHS